MRFKFRYYLDSGICLWCVDDETKAKYGWQPELEELPLTPEAIAVIKAFLKCYDTHYSYGCPPEDSWTVEDCKKFNEASKAILNIITSELPANYLICNCQLDLIEEPELLQEYYRNPQQFAQQRRFELYGR